MPTVAKFGENEFNQCGEIGDKVDDGRKSPGVKPV